MKSLPEISIVIPSYNKVKYIGYSLESIISQNYPNLEVVIQDGGSRDGTVEVIKKYANKYPKIISWVSEKDKGQVDAINKGFKKATGDIFAYLNADDVYEKGVLLAVGEHFSKNPETLWLAGKGKVIDETGTEIAKWVTAYKNFLLHLNSYNLLLIVNYFMQPSVFLSRKAYEKYGPFVGSHGVVLEYNLWLRLGRSEMPVILATDLSSFRLIKESLSAINYESILSSDYKICSKYTKDPFILFIHWLHNAMRIIALYTSRLLGQIKGLKRQK